MKQIKKNRHFRIIKHSWQSIGFLKWKCKRCGCEKHRIINTAYLYYYYRSGIQLCGLPECKSLMNCDNINNGRGYEIVADLKAQTYQTK